MYRKAYNPGPQGSFPCSAHQTSITAGFRGSALRQEREGRKKWGRKKESVPLLVTTTFLDPPLLNSTCCSEKDSQLQQLEGTK